MVGGDNAMIRIGNEIVSEETLQKQPWNDGTKRLIIHKLSASDKTYTYPSIKALEFELNLRSKICESAERLNNSRFAFEVFEKSRCNPEYWTRTSEGGFKLKPDADPYLAIKDFLVHSAMYATECATAIVIVYYLGLTEVLPQKLFNQLFANLYLMDWKYLDKDLGLRSHAHLADYLPGDCRYFMNPDVNPKTIEWQGENAIQLKNGYYYGHGIGIRTAEGIIRELNRNRIPNATKSAYLMDLAIRPNYRYLFNQYERFMARQ